MNFTVFLGNLPTWVTADDIKVWLNAENLVADSIKVIRNHETQESKGFAFVEMTNQSEAQKAISMFNGYNMGDRELKVSMARPREERGGFGNRGGGQSRRAPQRGGNKRY